MSKKIGLNIGGRRFGVDTEDEFAIYLEKEMERDFNIEGNNDIKEIFLAYIRKSHEVYLQNKKIDEIIKEIEKS
jgi:hypothetical protein